MPDKTDERLRALEAWLQRLYKDAESEMRGKWDKYLSRMEDRAETLLSRIREAKTDKERAAAEEAYKNFLKSKTAGDKHYRDMVKELAHQYAIAGEQAAKMINHENLMSYIDGYNDSAAEYNSIAIARNIGIRFDLIDQDAVSHLAEHAEDLLLPRKADPSTLDLEVWNVHQINAQITQGIVQGEGPDKMAKRLENVTHMNTVASIRTARTMVTGSRNAGHLQNMRAAEQWGVHAKKQWRCLHDSRTRDSHLDLDMVTVGFDEAFPNGCMFPGDPAGPPAEVYNCRCGLHKTNIQFSSNLPKGKENAVHVWIDGEKVR